MKLFFKFNTVIPKAPKPILGFFLLILLSIGCAPTKAKCPAYTMGGPGQSALSSQDLADKSPEEIQQQSQTILDTQPGYLTVSRDKKSGLIKNTKKVKNWKNISKRQKKYKVDPERRKGLDFWE
jgi:hypothetical protein